MFARTASVNATRRFSTTLPSCQDGPSGKTLSSTRPTDKPQTARASPSNSASQPGRLLIRRQPVDSRPPRSSQPPQGGQVLRRNPSVPARRSGPQVRSGQPGQILRRTGPPGTSGRPGQPGQLQQGGQRKKRRPADRVRAQEPEEDFPTEAELDEHVTKFLDRPDNPTEHIQYNPKPQLASDLQQDWPNTPLSSTGLSASVIQKIEWLARRIPHGYQTPGQLAEHYHEGNLTRFESEEEKEAVLKIAADLAQKQADALTEYKGEQIATEDMTASSLSEKNDDKNMLLNSVVKGTYPDLEKQRMPFLDSIVRNLRNNGTYDKGHSDQFMAKIQSLMPAQRTGQQQTQKQKA